MSPASTTNAATASWGIWPEASRETLVRTTEPTPPCPNPKEMRLVLMLGMHRSGTSALAGVMETCGLNLGSVNRESHPYNRKGHFSNSAVDALNEALVTVPVAGQEEPAAIHDEGLFHWFLNVFSDGTLGGMKDPEFNLTAPLWAKHVEQLTAVATLRHPMGVVRSIVVRNGVRETRERVEEFVEAWYHYNVRLLWMRKHFAFPIVDFDAPRDDYLAQIESVCAALGLAFNAGGASAFISEDLVHNRGLEHEIVLPRPVEHLYDELHAYTLRPAANEWIRGSEFVAKIGHDIRRCRLLNMTDRAIAAKHYEDGIGHASALLYGQSLERQVDNLQLQLEEARLAATIAIVPPPPPAAPASNAQLQEAVLLAEAYKSEIDRRDERLRRLHRENADLRNDLQGAILKAERPRFQQAGGRAAG